MARKRTTTEAGSPDIWQIKAKQERESEREERAHSETVKTPRELSSPSSPESGVTTTVGNHARRHGVIRTVRRA